MHLSERNAEKYPKLPWTLYFPTDEHKREILEALAVNGHPVATSGHLWQGATRPMYDISWKAVQFVADTFPARRYKRILLRQEPCRGWMALDEPAGSHNSREDTRTNNNLFRRSSPAKKSFGSR